MIKEEFSNVKTFNYKNVEYNILLDNDYAKGFSKIYVEAVANLVKKDFIIKNVKKLSTDDYIINSKIVGKTTMIIYCLEENNLTINFITSDNKLIL